MSLCRILLRSDIALPPTIPLPSAYDLMREAVATAPHAAVRFRWSRTLWIVAASGVPLASVPPSCTA